MIITWDGTHVLLSGANLHCTARFVVNGQDREVSVRKVVFVVFSWFSLAKTSRRMDWMDGWIDRTVKRTLKSSNTKPRRVTSLNT